MIANRWYPNRIDDKRHARNRFLPEDTFLRKAHNAANHVQAYRCKGIFSRGDLINTPASAAGTTVTRFRFRNHSAYGARYYVFRLTLGLHNDTLGTPTNPRVDIDVTIAGGATTTATVYHGQNAGGITADSPNELVDRVVRVAIDPVTTYEVNIDEIDGARILAICVHEEHYEEIDTSRDFYVDQLGGQTGFPIYDATRGRLLEGLSKVWRRGGPMLLCWPGETTAPTFTGGTTFTNIIDSTTAVAASSAGWYLGDTDATLEMLARMSDNKTIDVVFAVYAQVTGGNTGEVRLQDSGGTRCSITGVTTTLQWHTSSTTIANLDTLGKVDLQARVTNPVHSLSLRAVSIYAHLT